MIVIDIHSHVFNAFDIPVKGFLNANIKKKSIIKILLKIYESIREKPGAYDDLLDYQEEMEGSEFSKCDVKKLVDHMATIFPEIKGELDAEIKEILNESSIDPQDYYAKLEKAWEFINEINDYINWFLVLMLKNNQIARKLAGIYDEVNLFTPLMIDMEKWVADSPVNSQLEQSATLGKIHESSGGKIHGFIAFDPRRAKEEGVDTTLNRILTAVEERGFIGVKLYPSFGYRPAENAKTIPPLDAPEEYDEIMKSLFALCCKHEIPITTHCTPFGAALTNESGKNADPASWEPILAETKFENLRINFAHFGGIDNLLNPKNSDKWAKKILNLMQHNSNVYTDVSHHNIMVKRNREKFFPLLQGMMRSNPILYDRIMFGTDWHMLARLDNHREFLKLYKKNYRNILDTNADELLGKFMGLNALKFLGIRPEGQNSKRLKNYYQQKILSAPQWLIQDS